MKTLTGRTGSSGPEQGSISVMAILIASTVLIMMGIAVDVSGHVHAMQEARSVAREAARAGGQEVNVPAAIRGQGAQANPGEAAAVAQAYLNATGTPGSVSVTGPDTIRVDVNSNYQTLFLSVIGIGSMSSTGQAEARVARVVNGVTQ